MARADQFLIEREDLSGPINLASPNPLPNREFMRAFRDAWGTKIGIGGPAWLLEVAAYLIKTETELILKVGVSCPRACCRPDLLLTSKHGGRQRLTS